ncbi:MAG: sensor histidine kinase [Vicinamibacterales bacterium]
MSRWWRSHSVRLRLTVWYVAAMIVVLGVYASAVYTFVSQNVSDSLDASLRSDFWYASALVAPRADGSFTCPLCGELESEELVLAFGGGGTGFGQGERPWLQVWSPDGTLLYQSPEAARMPVVEGRDLVLSPAERDGIVTVQAGDVPMRLLTRHGETELPGDPSRAVPVVIQVGRSAASVREQLDGLLLMLALGLPLGVAAAGLGGYVLARRALLPVERMAERARSITADRLSERLPVENPDDEMGRLATVFNETLGRLEASFEQMRRFTADVSHELRTPLTAIRSVGEVGLREHRDETKYRSIIGSMLEEVDRLAGLVDRLLALSRAETGQGALLAEVIDLNELADDVAAHLGVLAEEKRQSIAIERDGTPRARGERLVLRQALINLVFNAIKYTPVGGRIRLRVAEVGDRAVIDVIDSGPGIPPGPQARIFERYFRVGDVPGVDEGGTGLGLSIARWAIESSGGQLTLEHTGPAGSAFRIALPAVRAPFRRAAS